MIHKAIDLNSKQKNIISQDENHLYNSFMHFVLIQNVSIDTKVSYT